MSTRTLSTINQLVVHYQGLGERPLTLEELNRGHRTLGRWGKQREDHTYPMPPNPGPQYTAAIHPERGPWTVAWLQKHEAILWHVGPSHPMRRNGNRRSMALIVLWGLKAGPTPEPAYRLLVDTIAQQLMDPALPNLTRAEQVLLHREAAKPGHTKCSGDLVDPHVLRADVDRALIRRRRVLPSSVS